MKIKCLIVALCLCLASQAAVQTGLLPVPERVEMRPGAFTFSSHTRIAAESRFADLVPYLKGYLPKGLPPIAAIDAPYNTINISHSILLADEEYRLSITPSAIKIEAGDYGGAFNAIVTMLQLADNRVYSAETPKIDILCAQIEDKPMLDYRGFMLDVARTFQTKEQVKRVINNLSLHKINKMHWHLSDDEGWRIEIKAYPKLTAIGAFRGGDSPIRAIYGKWDKKYGGYYTQNDIREIVEYARVRNIEIIPEIDLPGHSRAAAHAYPEILCDFTPDASKAAGYDRRNVWCASSEQNYKMLQGILTEIAALFPSKYIHIGGDEVAMSQWEKCPNCRALMKTRRMSSRRQLFDLFVERTSHIVESLGKHPAVWDEAAESGKMKKTTHVYSWRDMKKAQAVADKGYKTVIMAGSYFYFDMKQSPTAPGATWAGMVDTYRVYSFNPAQWGFDNKHTSNIIGIQAGFFTEILLSQLNSHFNYTDYQLFPRVCALSEVAWNSDRRPSWDAFSKTLNNIHFTRMEAMGIAARPLDEDKSIKRASLPPMSVTEVDIPISSFATESGLWYARLRSNEQNLKIAKMSIITQDTTEPIISYPQKVNPLNQLRVRPSELNMTGVLRFAIKNESSENADIAFELQPSPYIEPAVTLTSTMGQNTRLPFKSATDYNAQTICYTARTCRIGDSATFTFASPVDAKSIVVATGLSYLPRHQMTEGYVEISHDSATFKRIANLHGGSLTIEPDAPVKAIRIVSTCEGNGENFVAIQDLKITPRK